jgi:hypothetical protein
MENRTVGLCWCWGVVEGGVWGLSGCGLVGAVYLRGLMEGCRVRRLHRRSMWAVWLVGVVLLNQVGVVFRPQSGIPQPDQDLQSPSKTSRN